MRKKTFKSPTPQIPDVCTKQKIQKKFIYEGLGFPVILVNVPMIFIRGVWTPHINYNALMKIVLHALCHKPSPLSGVEVRFIREYFEMTTTKFGELFGVSHAAVLKWEKQGLKPAKITPTTEKCIRLFILEKLSASDKEIIELYRAINIQKLAKYNDKKIHPLPISINAQEELEYLVG